ncbi:hypothetical protein KBY93_14105 [Synechococcus sp. J7-Johnson]|uniref:hypothetical protein n=1 Tax=Synechococcus sp. J7-Johnson TaxID=2823737 RepID=UPI0020CC98F7|nr:hypothetical protein [Synechococcus sp. J7-Johnson]MCP9841755.1 hypothetical protein [Synechococcus sp. J7-Johnson]
MAVALPHRSQDQTASSFLVFPGVFIPSGAGSEQWCRFGIFGLELKPSLFHLHLQQHLAELPDHPADSWQQGHWRPLSPLDEPMAPPLEWVERVLFTD